MIIGTGIDICRIKRIRDVCQRLEERFLQRVYTRDEIRYSFHFNDPYPRLAGMFAAKEAVRKAFGERLKGIGLKEIEIMHLPSGQPKLQMLGQAKSLADEMGVKTTHISISHERLYAVAFALFEK